MASPFHVPVKDNAKLKALLERIQNDTELHQLWKSANINAVALPIPEVAPVTNAILPIS